MVSRVTLPPSLLATHRSSPSGSERKATWLPSGEIAAVSAGDRRRPLDAQVDVVPVDLSAGGFGLPSAAGFCSDSDVQRVAAAALAEERRACCRSLLQVTPPL